MENEKPIWEYFGDDEETEPVQFSKIEEHLVWHELGHLIGFVITKHFNYDFGTIIQLKLNHIGGNPSIKIDSDLFKAQRKVRLIKIDFGIGEYIYGLEDQKRLRDNLNDTYGFIVYSLYLLLGGLFNIYSFKKNPELNEFKMCFLDERDEIKSKSFVARAGNDWTKLRSLIKLKEWDEEIFIEFRFKLFYLLQDFDIFELFRTFIQKTDFCYNGKLIQGKEIRVLTEQVSKMLKTDRKYKENLTNLVVNTKLKLIAEK